MTTSSDIKLTMEEIKLMALFGDITGAEVRDCVLDSSGERIIFVVGPGNLGIAIGRRGSTIKRARTIMKRDIDVVEASNSPEGFVQNALAPAKVIDVKIQNQSQGRRVAIVTVESEHRGRVIGRNGRNIERARILAKRHHGIDAIIIA